MNVLIIFICFVVTVIAKPEGYAYQQPPLLVRQPAAFQPQIAYQPQATYQPQAAYQSQVSYQPQPAYQPQVSYQPQPAYQPQLTYQAPIVTSTVHKHVYVHVPPPDEEELELPQPLPVINHQKHYKIIFIKAPTVSSASQQILRTQQNINEEKTIVYVLVKKPESVTEIQQIQAESRVPSKPEVYFIKYKAEKQHLHSAPVLVARTPETPAFEALDAPAVVAPVEAPAAEPVLLGQGPSPELLAPPSKSLEEAPIVAGGCCDLPAESAPRSPSPVYGPSA